jgi:hypothetical protein
MALPNTVISQTLVRNTLGDNAWSNGALCNSPKQNRWAFYRGSRLKANATTKLVELTPHTNFAIGNFRSYEHTQSAPNPVAGGNYAWGPVNPGTFQFDSAILINKLNIKEIANYHSTAYDYYIIDAYDSEAERDSETDRKYQWIIPITFEAANPSVPVGHYLEDLGITQQPKSTELVSLTGISTTYTTLYLRTSIGTLGGTIGIRLDDPYSTLTITQINYPTLAGGDLEPTETGHFTINRDDVNVCSGNETNNLTAGTQTLTGYATAYNGSTGKRMTTTGNVDLWLVKDGVDYVKVSSGDLTGTYRYWSQASVPVANDEIWTVELRKTSGTWTEVTC